MSEELVVIPRAELERARGIATHRAVTAAVLFVIAFGGIAAAIWGPLGWPMTWIGLVSSAIVGTTAATAFVRARRARATIQGKLVAQQLPRARLLDS